MKIRPFEVAFPDFSALESTDEFSSNVKFDFRMQLEAGLFQRAAKPGFYIYQIEFGGHKHTGLVALNDVDDFFAGKVRKHEHTLSDKERQYVELILNWRAVLKPVLLTYPAVPEIQEWLQQYIRKHHTLFAARFDRRSHLHKIWQVHEPACIEALQDLFRRHVPRAYIADGHHRTTTMAILHEQREQYPDYDFDHLFCAFFDDAQLEILDYNRVVEALHNQSPLQFLARLSAVFEIEPLPGPARPSQKHELALYLSQEWFRLRWKSDILERSQGKGPLFDASLLNDWVLRDLLGITDVRSDQRIEYIEGSKGLKGIAKVCKSGKLRVGFVLYPVPWADLVAVADAGGSLPPKSTYFEPRLKSGILVQMLNRHQKV